MGLPHLSLTLVLYFDFTVALARQTPKAGVSLDAGKLVRKARPGTDRGHVHHTSKQNAEIVRSRVREVEVGAMGVVLDQDTSHTDSVHQKTSGKAFLAQRELKVALSKTEGSHVQEPITTKEGENWFSRLGDSLTNIIVGIVMVAFSIPIMWQNARHIARMQSLIADGEKECVMITDGEADPKHRGDLVLATGDAKAAKPVESKQFKDVKFDGDCLRLVTTVEVYQWIEHAETKESKNKFGGGKTKRTTYSYTKAWSSQKNDSSNYKDKSKVNHFPMTPTEATENCDCVEFGKRGGFVVPDALLCQLGNFESANGRLGASITTKEEGPRSSLTLKKNGEYFTHGPDNAIGSVRAKFEIVPDGFVTVLALQADGGTAETFLPYRPVAKGSLCGYVSDEVRKERLLLEANKSTDELSSEDAVSRGPFSVRCCCGTALCNLASRLFNAISIYKISARRKTKAVMFMSLKQDSSNILIIFYIVGLAMMFIGSYMLFDPILTMVDIIPFLGPCVSTLGGWLIWIVCLLVTLVLSCLILTAAYMRYRPMIGVAFVLATAALVAVPITIAALVKG